MSAARALRQLQLLTDATVDEMVHHRLNVRRKDSVPRLTSFSEVGNSIAIPTDVLLKLIEHSEYVLDRLVSLPWLVAQPRFEIFADARKLWPGKIDPP